MKKRIALTLACMAFFAFGFAFKTLLLQLEPGPQAKKVTGIGGIFFKCKDPQKLRAWYASHLGFITNPYGSVFEWHQGVDSTKKGFTQWSPFSERTKYFEPSTKDFMINYRVEHLEALVAQFRRDSVRILDTIERFEYGAFLHIMDPEGNKLELWEPNDLAYEKMGIEMGARTMK